METLREIAPRLGVAPTCAVLGVSSASYYRTFHHDPDREVVRPSPARTLPPAERTAVLEMLHEPRFVDLAPGEVYAQLLDDERYLCSERTMHRIREENREVRQRRDQLRHPRCAAPELRA